MLDGISFSMGVEAVGIIGRNGMGKTTLCDTLMGLIRPTGGEVLLNGRARRAALLPRRSPERDLLRPAGPQAVPRP